MNFFDILSQIENLDPELSGRIDSRRSVFKHMGGLGQKLGAAALPLAVGAIFNKAYGQTPAGLQVADILNFALKLEYLESFFYQQRSGLTSLSATNSAALTQIAVDEANHVTFLRTVITSLGSTVITPPPAAVFDFTAGGVFAGYNTNVNIYLALAQSFEDLGVRAYKGAAPLTAVMANKAVLTAALNIHSIEARHAAQIRAMRRALATSGSTLPSQGIPASPYSVAPKSWVSGTDSGGAAAPYSVPIYGAGNDNGPGTYGASSGGGLPGTAAGVTFAAESSATQGGIALSTTTSTSFAGFPAAAFTEAFDEGLDVGTVSTIGRLFVAPGYTFF
jgi:hypothetical protein